MALKMLNRKSLLHSLVGAALTLLLLGCTVSYKLNGASIDYATTKTIEISDFPLRSAYVWAPMHSMFNNELSDIYKRDGQLR